VQVTKFRVCVLWVSSHILPCTEDSVKDPPTEFNVFKKVSYNPGSGRKKLNLINRSVIWLYIDDTALLCLHPMWEGTLSAVECCQGSHVWHYPLLPFLMLVDAGIAASPEKDLS